MVRAPFVLGEARALCVLNDWGKDAGVHGFIQRGVRKSEPEAGIVEGTDFSRIALNNVLRLNVEQWEVRLVDRAAAGDRDARCELFERFRDVAYRVALRIAGRPEDALDVVQDSFIRAYERLGEFQRESGFQTWLLRIVSNRALDLLRARKVRLAVPLEADEGGAGPQPADPSATSAPGYTLEQAELADRLRRAIETLPPDQRAVFALYATGELSYGRIAEALGIPIGTVMSRLFHARRRLHAMLPDLAPATSLSENSLDG